MRGDYDVEAFRSTAIRTTGLTAAGGGFLSLVLEDSEVFAVLTAMPTLLAHNNAVNTP